ncbi:DUF6783 domain-containing protein [uncultured Robinsoniella sp.]|uniref:DUF6783 domain-containing protein n=1 Tax=uncultured Robinsoniella sp. TaxID=904190 RepID=UPI00374F4D55
MFENSSRQLHASLCGIFALNSGYAARYASCIQVKISQNVAISCQKAILNHVLTRQFIPVLITPFF